MVVTPPEDRKELPQSQIIFVQGNPGVGKTHLLNGLFDDLLKGGVQKEDVELLSTRVNIGYYIGMSNFNTLLSNADLGKSKHGKGRKEVAQHYNFAGPEILLIDDFGAEYPNLKVPEAYLQKVKTLRENSGDMEQLFTTAMYAQLTGDDAKSKELQQTASYFCNFIMAIHEMKSLVVMTTNHDFEVWRGLLVMGDPAKRALSRFDSMTGGKFLDIFGPDGRAPENKPKEALPFVL